jgi:hypothetical protein
MIRYGVRSGEELTMDDGELARHFEVDAQHVTDLDVAIDSAAIRRLIEEVRTETLDVPRNYNRTHNRHNR